MGVADIREAFQQGLGSAGSCIGATMDYLDGGAQQRLTFQVAAAGGAATVVEDCPADADLHRVARAAAERWAQG